MPKDPRAKRWQREHRKKAVVAGKITTTLCTGEKFEFPPRWETLRGALKAELADPVGAEGFISGVLLLMNSDHRDRFLRDLREDSVGFFAWWLGSKDAEDVDYAVAYKTLLSYAAVSFEDVRFMHQAGITNDAIEPIKALTVRQQSWLDQYRRPSGTTMP